jgi:phosphotransacetylase
VRLPAERVVQATAAKPYIILHRHTHLERLLRRSAEAPSLTAALACSCDRDSLLGPLQAQEQGAMQPILVGPRAAIEAAVRPCRERKAGALMKGSLHTDDLMASVVAREGGLRGGRRISHVFALDMPSYHKALCKMADRGQISGAFPDRPLAFDNAISRAAAAIKKITSPVVGDADILTAPGLEAGNMNAKQLSYLAAADSAGIAPGARVPVILTSRADSVISRLAAIALVRLLAAADRRDSAT